MTDVTMYPGARGSGKTTLILEQVWQASFVGQSVAIFTANGTLRQRLERLMAEWGEDHQPVPVFTESSIQRSRGYRFDHIFIDDADLFEDRSFDIVNHYHPGVPLTMAFTPRETRSLPTKDLTSSPVRSTLPIW